MKLISFKIENKIHEILKDRKLKTGTPISFQIREAIDLYIQQNKN